MKATVENTAAIVTVNGIQARVWNGVTDRGVVFELLVVRVAASNDADTGEFETDLREMAMPLVESAFPLRMVL